MGGSKNMTRGNFVTPTNASVTQDPLGNNLKKKHWVVIGWGTSSIITTP